MKEDMPSYIANAKANPVSNRAPWYKNIAPSYAGIILWFVFWQGVVDMGVPGGGLAHGLALPIISLVVAALLCHFLFYLAPAMFGMKTGHGLAVLGSSIFGTSGGTFMPGLLMGLLQFGWLAVNIYFASFMINEVIGGGSAGLTAIIIAEGVLATFIGLKGIKYVAGISTYLPLIPLVVLIVLLYKTLPYVGDFNPEIFKISSLTTMTAAPAGFAIFSFIVIYVTGFFATAGAAGADFGSSARNSKDVQLGGLVGVTGFMIFTGVAAMLILAGAYGNPQFAASLATSGQPLNPVNIMNVLLGETWGKTFTVLLAISAFPSACFASLIAANSFKAMLPKINSTLSVSVGGGAAILLAVTGLAANAGAVFGFIGASFGPICGAFAAEYLLTKGKWELTSEKFCAAGWLAWAVGFTVGVLPNFGIAVPVSPLVSFAIGFAVYYAVKIAMPKKA